VDKEFPTANYYFKNVYIMLTNIMFYLFDQIAANP